MELLGNVGHLILGSNAELESLILDVGNVDPVNPDSKLELLLLLDLVAELLDTLDPENQDSISEQEWLLEQGVVWWLPASDNVDPCFRGSIVV